MEVFPTTPWNYGLVLDEKKPGEVLQGGEVERARRCRRSRSRRTTAPIELRAEAKTDSRWKQDSLGLVGKLQPSPVKSDEPVETVTLIPMGAARLRITAFPVIGAGQGRAGVEGRTDMKQTGRMADELRA